MMREQTACRSWMRCLPGALAVAAIVLASTPRALAQPRAGAIDSVSPAAARTGELVTVRGRGFGALNVRIMLGGVPAQVVAASGSQVTLRVPVGVRSGPTQIIATNPGGQSGSIAFLMLDGILLPGDARAPALPAITNLAPPGVNDSDLQDGVILTQLDVFFSRDATIGDVNAVLVRIDGGIVSMLAGSAALSIAVPRQTDFAALQALAQRVSAMHGVQFAAPARAKQPQEIFVSTNAVSARHLVPGRVPAAWNAKALLNGCGANRVPVLIPDFYGPPPDGFAALFPGFGDLTEGISTETTHGYRMIAAMATPGDPSPTAGTNPFLDCLDLRPIQIANFSTLAVQNALFLRFPASGKFIVSMSLGDNGTCEDPTRTLAPCTPTLAGRIQTPYSRALNALRWKLFTQPRWPDFLIVAAAGNDRDSGLAGGLLYPGVTFAAVENEPAVASQPDPFFTFAADAGQWTPNASFLDQGFPDLAASAPDMAALRSDVMSLGLDTAVENNALIVGATTNLKPADVLVASPGYELLSEAPFSNQFPDVTTVGVDVSDVCVAVPCHTSSGTSIATPQVAGLASYLWLLSPALRALPASATRQAIMENTRDDVSNVSGFVDAYAAVLSLDAAQLPTPQSARVRLSLLDVNDDGAFDERDLAVFVGKYFVTNPDGTTTAVHPTAAAFDRYDLNGDGFTGGSNTERFDLDRVGSTQFGRTQYSTVSQAIENQNVDYIEASVSDLDILCYYAYSDLYTGSIEARRDLVARRCGVKVKVTIRPSGATVAVGAQQPFSVTVTGTNDPRVTWTATGGTIDNTTGIFTAGNTAGTGFKVRATSVADPTAFDEIPVTITGGSGLFAGTITETDVVTGGAVAGNFSQTFVANVVAHLDANNTLTVLQVSGSFNETEWSTVSGCFSVDTVTAPGVSAAFIPGSLRVSYLGGTDTQTNLPTGEVDPATGLPICGASFTGPSGAVRDFPYAIVRSPNGNIVALDFSRTVHKLFDSGNGVPDKFLDTTATGRLEPVP
jgi:hypothetical protein